MRRSTRILRVRQISSAMSVGVTEPKSAPVGPGLDLEPQDGLRQRRRDLGGLLGRAGLVPGALVVDPPDLGDPPGRRHLGELPRQQVVAGVAALDVDDVALQAELLDVAAQDDLHHDPCT